MTWRMVLLVALCSFGLADTGARAQLEALEAYEDCLDGVDLEAMEARYERLAEAQDIEPRLEAACAAGDRDGAAALWESFEAELYAGPDGMRAKECLYAQVAAMRAYLTELGQDFSEDPHVCDEDF